MIRSLRIEAGGDTPNDVLNAFNEVLGRLGLGAGMGELVHGATELVIEGGEYASYKGRIKLNFGPMSAVAEAMWREGKDPYGKDNAEYEQKRLASNAEHAHAEAFESGQADARKVTAGWRSDDEPFPLSPDQQDTFTKLVIVKGRPVIAVTVVQGIPVEDFIHCALNQGGEPVKSGLTPQWELRDKHGNRIVSEPWEAAEPLYLNPKPGAGG